MDSLINPNTRQWRADLVDGLFVAEDAQLIKKIPLSQVATEDMLNWPYSSNGVDSCKSGYRSLKEESKLAATSQVPPLWDKHVWKGIWSI